MEIRTAELSDLDAIAQVEAECFPAAEAATEKSLKERLKAYSNHFWLLLDEGKLVSFVDGMVTDQKDLTDDLYENAQAHDETGAWQMIFGVNTIPASRYFIAVIALLNRLNCETIPSFNSGMEVGYWISIVFS